MTNGTVAIGTDLGVMTPRAQPVAALFQRISLPPVLGTGRAAT